MSILRILPVLAPFVMASAVYAASTPPLFEKGKTQWKILLSEPGNPTISYAGSELARALNKISGAEFVIAKDPGEATNGPVIAVGVDPALAKSPESVAVVLKGNTLHLAGETPRAALYAVYTFLQDTLGVRWLWIGDDGEFMPSCTTFTLPEGLRIDWTPKMKYRGFHLCGDWYRVQDFRVWMARNFINIHRHGLGNFKDDDMLGFHKMYSSHNVALPRTVFAEHPDYFAEINGRRYPTQVCMSNPEVDKLVVGNLMKQIGKRTDLEILSLFLADNQEYCRCAQCRRKDVSTAWFDMFNRITDMIGPQKPGLKFAALAYQGYIRVPTNRIRNCEFVEYASYGRCNIHPYGTPGCQQNERVLHAMEEWRDTGLPMGNYTYEFDLFSSMNEPFLPFLSVIEDAVKTGVRLGHVAMISEIGLSPKNGPAIKVGSVHNRLPLYLYARLMRDPDRTKEEILHDWCKTAYGTAADPMYEYFILLDRSWSSLDMHRTILGGAEGVANRLFTADLRAQIETLFKKADAARGGTTNGNVTFEKQLYNVWLTHLDKDALLSLPRLKGEEAGDAFLTAQGRGAAIQGFSGLTAGWTTNALHVAGASGVTITLSTGLGGETWAFTVGTNGAQSAAHINALGVKDVVWNPEWTVAAASADPSRYSIRIPFRSIGVVPQAGDEWQVAFESQAARYPASGFAALNFCAAERTGRSIYWWTGTPAAERWSQDATKASFRLAGWEFAFVPQTNAPDAWLKTAPDAYWFRNPEGSNRVPREAWQTVRKNIGDGGLGVFMAYQNIALERYFDDPSFAVTIGSIGENPLVNRRSSYVEPGKWQLEPHNISNALRNAITPAYAVTPKVPSAWKVLARMPWSADDPAREMVYMMARPYGKGLVVVIGADARIGAVSLVDNYLANMEELRSVFTETANRDAGK